MVDLITRSSWAVRRRIIIATLLWCASLVTYLAIWGRPITLVEAIASGCLLLMGSVIGTYVFGATWDDQAKRKAQVAQAAVDQSDPTSTTVKVEP